LLEGDATLLSSHAWTSPTGDERHNKRKSDPDRSTASKRVSSPPVGTFSSVPDVADKPRSKQQASKQQRRRDEAAECP
jgi:hypothetical protein